MAKYSIFALIGEAERDWIHVLRTQSGTTLCGFTPQERMKWTGNPIWTIRAPQAQLADCPDCLRKFEQMVGRKLS